MSNPLTFGPTDLIISAGLEKKTFHVHRAAVSQASPTLANVCATICPPNAEGDYPRSIHILWTDALSMQHMIDYIYTNKLSFYVRIPNPANPDETFQKLENPLFADDFGGFCFANDVVRIKPPRKDAEIRYKKTWCNLLAEYRTLFVQCDGLRMPVLKNLVLEKMNNILHQNTPWDFLDNPQHWPTGFAYFLGEDDDVPLEIRTTIQTVYEHMSPDEQSSVLFYQFLGVFSRDRIELLLKELEFRKWLFQQPLIHSHFSYIVESHDG